MSPRPSLALLALALLAACGRKGERASGVAVEGEPIARAATAAARPSASSATAEDGAAPVDAGAWAFDCGASASPASAKSVGHTSVVFKLTLSNGHKAAWKPHARRVRDRYRGEIAAYRLARALGLDNVPPACARTFEVGAVRAALAPRDAASVFDEQVVTDGGEVHGALIPWIEGLRFWPLAKEPLRSEVRAWLAGGELPPAKADLARQASDLVVFDFLTGNWDRYTGENVGLDAPGTHVLFIDNDAAFMARPPASELARNRARVEATNRFSRRLVGAIRALDRERLVAALGEERPGRPLLADTVVARVHERAVALVTLVDAKIRARGEAATLYFE